jgi:hypothetical protein
MCRRKRGSATGPSPVDRARNGSKHHLLVEATGIPLAWTVTGGNRHDVTQLIPLIERIPPVRGKVGRPRQRPQRVTADRGYDHEKYRRELRRRRIKPEIARRQTTQAPGSVAPAGWWSAPSPGSITSNGCSCATTAATRFTKPSSRSAAASSASGGSSAHCDSSSKFTPRHAERWVGSVRRKCLDRILIVSRAHLERGLREYVAYYNTHGRTARCRAAAAPCRDGSRLRA